MSDIELTVCIITYNHINYIQEAIDSVLNQNTNFDYKILIADDNSTDGTTALICRYKEKYPDKIELILQSKNIGPAANFKQLMTKPDTKYMAYLDGDDYWVDSNKLQAQYDLLKNDQEIGLVYTHCKFFYQNINKLEEVPVRHPKDQEMIIQELLVSKFIEFSSTMFRRDLFVRVFDLLKSELETGLIGDTRLLLEMALHSKIAFIPTPMTVYRLNYGSASRPLNLKRYSAILLDSYICRKQFVFRNNLPKTYLSHFICNVNRGLINTAFRTKSISSNYLLLKEVLFLDTIRFCKQNVFFEKMGFKIILKFGISLLSLNILINNLRK